MSIFFFFDFDSVYIEERFVKVFVINYVNGCV